MRERILHAYMELASQQGLDRMTMDEVATRAGVSKRTLYRYFPAKEALLLAAVEEMKVRLAEKVNQMLTFNLNPDEIVAEILMSITTHGRFIFNQKGVEDLRVRYPQIWEDIDQFRQQRIQQVFGSIVRDMDPDVSPAIITKILLTAVHEVLNPEFILSNQLTFEDAARQTSRLLLRMISK
ncbi:MAG: TetR/AcrR family transcriptional regulator [Methylocystaceae bacterium]